MKFPPFKISNLLFADVGTEQDFDVEETAQDLEEEDPKILSPLSFSISFLKLKDRIEAHFSHLSTTVSNICSRCLTPIQQSINIPFFSYDYLLYPEASDRNEAAENFSIDMKKNEIDISEALRDEILLATNVFALCTPDCKGICSVCGKNRNITICACESTPQEGEGKPLSYLKTLWKKYEKKR